MSLFLAKLHVANADGTVITPDILIDRVLSVGPDGTSDIPVSMLSHEVEMQVSDLASEAQAAYTLIAAGAGTLIAPSLVLADGRVSIARSAWRLRQRVVGGQSFAMRLLQQEVALTDDIAPGAVISQLTGEPQLELPRALAVVCPLEDLTSSASDVSDQAITLQTSDRKAKIGHRVALLAVDAQDPFARPTGEYSVGPQTKPVTHYI